MADGHPAPETQSRDVLKETLQLVGAILLVLAIVTLAIVSIRHSGGWPAG